MKDEKECCPPFEPGPWQDKEHVWNEKRFIKDGVPQLFHIPFPPMIGKAITRMMKKAEDAQAKPDAKDVLLLMHDPSPWRSDYYLSVTKDVPGAENVSISGRFISRVYDGPYQAVPKWIKDMDAKLAEKGLTAKRYFFHYTACPKCAKKYGHNYVVAFAEV